MDALLFCFFQASGSILNALRTDTLVSSERVRVMPTLAATSLGRAGAAAAAGQAVGVDAFDGEVGDLVGAVEVGVLSSVSFYFLGVMIR